MSDALIDTRYRVETPEGIDLEAQLAGPVPRVLAYSIDLFARSMVIALIAAVLGFLGQAGQGFVLVAAFVLEWFYPVFFEVLRRGQTPGKQVLGIAVVNNDLTPVTWNTSVVRNILRAADFLPMLYLGGLVCMLVDPRFRRLGDLAAGTLVVHRQDQQATLSLPEVPPRAATVPLDLDDQIAIINFTQRHEQLSEDRQKELANILAPITSVRDEKAVNYLHGVGRWLLGGKQ